MKSILFAFILWFSAFAQSYDGQEDFEGTGTPIGWPAPAGTVDYDYTTVVLEGTQSMSLTGVATSQYVWGTTLDSVWMFFTIQFDTTRLTNQFLYFRNASTTVTYLSCLGARRLYMNCGTAVQTADDFLLPNTQYYFWLFYKKGTGTNAVAKVYKSLTSIRPASPALTITNGTATLAADRLQISSVANSHNIIDQLLIDNVEIGDIVEAPATATTIKRDFGGWQKWKTFKP